MENSGEDTLELYLEKEKMLEWDGWNSEARSYLKELDEEIYITQLAEEYQTEVNDFYNWLRPVIISAFYDELMKTITAQLILEQERSTEST